MLACPIIDLTSVVLRNRAGIPVDRLGNPPKTTSEMYNGLSVPGQRQAQVSRRIPLSTNARHFQDRMNRVIRTILDGLKQSSLRSPPSERQDPYSCLCTGAAPRAHTSTEEALGSLSVRPAKLLMALASDAGKTRDGPHNCGKSVRRTTVNTISLVTAVRLL